MARQKQQVAPIMVGDAKDAPILSDDDIYMLAALDYRLHDLRSKDREKNLEAVARYLEVKRGKLLSLKEIKSRLTELEEAFVPKKWKKSVFRNGSKAFSKDFPLSQRKSVEKLKNEHREENIGEIPQPERALRNRARLTKQPIAKERSKWLRSAGASIDEVGMGACLRPSRADLIT
jgi:hypothetical protein